MVYLFHQLGLLALYIRRATQRHTSYGLLFHCTKSTLPTLDREIILASAYIRILPEGIHRIEIIRLYRYFFDGPDNHSCLAYFHNINSHAINSVLMIVDQVVVAFPTRIIHFVYPALIVIAYLVFSIVYFLIGGENVIGKPYIYRILNWGEYPVSSSLVACSGLLLVLPMCVLAFLIYKLRVRVSSSNCLS
uniref:Protein rolling stone n=1 Tax=Bactrocera latifrons TaxID=174628 RepID=A0A0K8VWB6_BACLA